MPSRQPFTRLCGQIAGVRSAPRADLHVHTARSDGTLPPAAVVALAREAGLAAVAVTDHDTLAGWAEAAAAAGDGPEVIPGVEITSEFRGRELHLLGYFVRPDDPPLLAALGRLAASRVGRFAEMVRRCRALGLSVPEEGAARLCAEGGRSLGRRHLAELLVAGGEARTVAGAFARHLQEGGPVAVPKDRLPAAEALQLVREAGGVASWAHPPEDCTEEEVFALREMGLGALEAEYPWPQAGRRWRLRRLANSAGLAVSGGSDFHDPGAGRLPGACGIRAAELERLRALAVQSTGVGS
ncbi:MAG TPA: PHP domain-containing protein [Gemmataceae bacterium]